MNRTTAFKMFFAGDRSHQLPS